MREREGQERERERGRGREAGIRNEARETARETDEETKRDRDDKVRGMVESDKERVETTDFKLALHTADVCVCALKGPSVSAAARSQVLFSPRHLATCLYLRMHCGSCGTRQLLDGSRLGSKHALWPCAMPAKKSMVATCA